LNKYLDIKNFSDSISGNEKLLSPISGMVLDIIQFDNFISLEIEMEPEGILLFPCIRNPAVKKGDKITIGEEIGVINGRILHNLFCFILLRKSDIHFRENLLKNEISFSINNNSRVNAMASRTVNYVGYDPDYGMFIEIANNDTIIRYMHLSMAYVVKKQNVLQGQLIAKTGETGLVDKPQLTVMFEGIDGKENPQIIIIEMEK
jgi:hypothetical protein